MPFLIPRAPQGPTWYIVDSQAVFGYPSARCNPISDTEASSDAQIRRDAACRRLDFGQELFLLYKLHSGGVVVVIPGVGHEDIPE
jgi:hypothetical protein